MRLWRLQKVASEMKISVALCTYNGERFLEEQLQSIAAQTRPPDEVIVSDDASADGTVSLLHDFAQRNALSIRVSVNKRPLGVLKNFEKAIGMCGGDVIFLCDQDDVWHPDKMRIQSDLMADETVVMVFSEAVTVTHDLEPLLPRMSSATFTERAKTGLSSDLFGFLLERNIVTGMTMAIRSSALKVAVPFPTDIPETIHDGWLAVVASLMGRCVFVDKPLVKYRQHPNQIIGANTIYRNEEGKVGLSRRDSMEKYRQNSEYNIQRLQKLYEHLEHQVFSQILPSKRQAAVAAWNRELDYWKDRADHFATRVALPISRSSRILSIWKEVRNRRYFRYSNGVGSMLKDLVTK